MSISQRYLFRETLMASLSSLLVFVGVMLALFFAELLGEAAQGQLPLVSVLWLLVFRLPDAVLMVGPLALMVGLLLALGRLGEQSEMVVLRASGLRFSALIKPVGLLAIAWSLSLLLLAGWIAPLALERSSGLMADAARQALLAGLQPGQFERLEQGRLIIYIGSVDRLDGSLRDVFVQHDDGFSSEVLTAPRGFMWTDPDDDARYLSLVDGVQLMHAVNLEGGGTRQIRFARNDIRLPAPELSGGSEGELVMTLPQLAREQGSAIHREWHWRLAAPLAAVVLALLALPLSDRLPRQGRFGPVLLALGIYLVYTNAIHAGLIMIDQQGRSSGVGLWPLHALLAALAVVLVWRKAVRW